MRVVLPPAVQRVWPAMTSQMKQVPRALAAYRKMVARNEDDNIHMLDPNGEIMNEQKNMATSLARIDRIGIAVTVVTAAYGVALLATTLYQNFAHPSIQ